MDRRWRIGRQIEGKRTVNDILKSISDDCLFPLPSALSTWDGCVKVWNDCLDFEQHWEGVLRECISRGVEGALSKDDMLLWDSDLDALIGRLAQSDRLKDQAFWAAMQLRGGLAKGDVVESDSKDGKALVQIEGGGLPRRGRTPDVRFTVRMVEPMCGQYIAVQVGLPFVQCSPDELEGSLRKRGEIKPLKADGPGVLPLPPELFGDVVEKLKGEINPTGLNIDRRSALLAFWHETIWRQRTRPWPFEEQDILRVKPTSGRPFHVVYMNSWKEDSISCYKPKSKGDGSMLLALDNLSAKSNKLSVEVPRRAFCRDGERTPVEALLVLAMRETARARQA